MSCFSHTLNKQLLLQMNKEALIARKMVKQGNSSKRFFRVILNQIIENGLLELPKRFVKKHGKHLSNCATLKVPTGEESKLEIKKYKGQAWLHRGWPEFVVKYSIKPGYFLSFRYKGRSRFSVLIFGYTCLEIQYPPNSANTCKLIEVKEEEGDDDILDEYPHKFQRVGGVENVNLNRSTARDRVMEKAKAFKSSNPHFFVIMKPTSKHSLYIPSEPGRSYFRRDKRDNSMRLIREDGKAWSMNYNVGSPPRNRVRICSGWTKFFKDTSLQEGDACVFELVSSSSLTFKVTLFQAAELEHEEETNKNDLLLITTAHSCEKRRISSMMACTVMERAKNFKCGNPHFTIRLTSYYLSSRPRVHIPVAHSSKYLKNEDSITILDGSNGKNWLVYLSLSSTKVALSKGWKDFASANRLQVGDVLVFEMMNVQPKAYKANIFRVAS